jgi:anti-anti-sigma regulatory factor
VLVLDVAALPGLDDLAALELRALLRALREERRQLVLAGVDEDQLQALDDAGVLLDFDADDVCHDQHAAELRAHELVLAMAA